MTIDIDPTASTTEAYDVKAHRMVAVVSSQLDDITVTNTVGHMLVALGAVLGSDLLGRRNLDATGTEHAAVARYPFVLKTARPSKIRAAIVKAKELGVVVVDYPEEAFLTTHDDDYMASLAARKEADLVYIGAAFFGATGAIDEVCGRFMLWSPRA
jgi:hypothetical protein